MSCYTASGLANPINEQYPGQLATDSTPGNTSQSTANTGALRRLGQHFLRITQRRQAERVRRGRLLAASWRGSSKNAANPARFEQ